MEYRVPELHLHNPRAAQNRADSVQWPQLRNQQRQDHVGSTLPAHSQTPGHNAILLPNHNNVNNALPVYAQHNGHNSLPVNTHIDGRNTFPLQRKTNAHNALSVDTHVNGHNALPMQRQNDGHDALSLQRQNNGQNALPLHAQNSAQTTSHILQYPCYGASDGVIQPSSNNQGSNFFNINRQHQVQQAFNLSKDSPGLSIDCAPSRVPALLNYLSDNNMTFDQLVKTLKSRSSSAGTVHNVSASAHIGSSNRFQTASTVGQAGTASTHVRPRAALASRPGPGIQTQQPRAATGKRMTMNEMPPCSIQNVQHNNNVTIPHQHLPGNNIHGLNQDFLMIQASNPKVYDGPSPHQIRQAVNNLHNNNQSSQIQDRRQHNYSSSTHRAPQTVMTTTSLNPSRGFRPHIQAYSNLSSTSLTPWPQPQNHIRAPSSARNVPADVSIWEKVDGIINDALSKNTSRHKVRPDGKANQRNISNLCPVSAKYPVVSSRLNSDIPMFQTVSVSTLSSKQAIHTTRSPSVSNVTESRPERVNIRATASMTMSGTTPVTIASVSGTQNIRPVIQTRGARTVTIDINGVRHVLELPSSEPVSHVSTNGQCETTQNEASSARSEQLKPGSTSSPSCSSTGLCADGISVPENDNTLQQEAVVSLLKKEHVQSSTASTLTLPASTGRERIDVEHNKDSCVDTVINTNKDVPDSVAQLNATDRHDNVKSYSTSSIHVITPDKLPNNGEIKSRALNATVEYIDKNGDTEMSENQGDSDQLSGQKGTESNESESLSDPQLIHVIRPEILPFSSRQTSGYPKLNSSDKESGSGSTNSSVEGQAKTEIASQENLCPISDHEPQVSNSESCNDRKIRPCGINMQPACTDSKTEVDGRAVTAISKESVEFSSPHQADVLSVHSFSPLSFSKEPGSAQSNNGGISDSVIDKNETARSGGNAVSEELSDSGLKTNQSPISSPRLVPKGSSDASSKEKNVNFTGIPDRQERTLDTICKKSEEVTHVAPESAASKKRVERDATKCFHSKEVLSGTDSVSKNKITVTGCVQKQQHSSVTGLFSQSEHLKNAVGDISVPKGTFECCDESEEKIVDKDNVPKDKPKYAVSRPVDHAMTSQSLFKETSQTYENTSRPVQKVAPFFFKETENDCFSRGALKSKYEDTARNESQSREQSDSLNDNYDDCSTEGYSSSAYEETFSDEDVSTKLTSRKSRSAGYCFKSSCENAKESLPKLRRVRVRRDRRNMKKLQSGSIDDGTTHVSKLTDKGVGRARHKGKRKLSDSEEVKKSKFRRIRVISESDSESDEEQFRHVAKFRRVRIGRRPHGLKELSCDSGDEYSTEMPKLRKVRVNRVRRNMNRNVFDILRNDLRINENSDGDHSASISKCEVIRTPQDKESICITQNKKTLRPLRVVLDRVDTKGKFSIRLNEKKKKIVSTENLPRHDVLDHVETEGKFGASLNKKKQKIGSSENRQSLPAVGQNKTLVTNSHIKNSLIGSSSKHCQPLRENITQLERSPTESCVTTPLHVANEESCSVVAQSISRQLLKENTKQLQSSSSVSLVTSVIENPDGKFEALSVATSGSHPAPNKNSKKNQKKYSLVDSLVHGLNEKKDQLRLLYKPADDDVILLDD